jgi:hypothetical protein
MFRTSIWVNARHPDFVRPPHVLEEPIADEHGVVRDDSERLQRTLEDRPMRLALPELRREDREVDPFRDPHPLEVAVQEPARIERVRNEPELQPARPKRFQERVRRRTQLARRLPSGVLRFEKPPELLVGDVQPQVAE